MLNEGSYTDGQRSSPTCLERQGAMRQHSVACVLPPRDAANVHLLHSFCQNAPEQFTSEEFPVTESKVSMDVSFPGAAFVVVSCKEGQLGCRKE